MVFILTHGCVARWVLRGVRADIELVGGLVGIHRRYVFALADVWAQAGARYGKCVVVLKRLYACSTCVCSIMLEHALA